MRTRSSSAHNRGSLKQIPAGQQRKSAQGKLVERPDYRKVKSYLEDESMFKDIERSTEYQDPRDVNLND